MTLAMMAFDLRAVAETSAAGIVDCLFLGTFVAVFAGLLLRMARRLDARTRFAVCFASLMAIATVPLIKGPWGPHAAGISNSGGRVAVTLPGSWAVYVFGVWALIAVLSLGRVAIGVRHLYKVRRSCVPVGVEGLDAQVLRILARTRTMRRVTLCTSDEVQVPTVIGLFRPAVLVPSWTLEELSPNELNQILIHELAHVRRWDDWTNFFQQIVKALFFFHPAVWWIERRLSLEREMACDDAVLAETASPRAYAECLAHLAERNFVRRSIVLAQAVLGRMRQTSERVAQILDANRPPATRHSWRVAVPLVAVFVGATVFAVSNTPELIAFSDPEGVALTTLKNTSLDSTSVTPFAATVIPAKLVTPSGANAHRIGQKSTARARSKLVVEKRPQLVAHNSALQNRSEGMIHLANVSPAPVVSTETVLVVFESSDVSGSQAAYQIRVWRVLLWHPPLNSTEKRVPPKQI